MIRYSFRRVLTMLPIVVMISIVVFSLAKLMPGDALSGQIDPLNTDPAYIDEMREKLGSINQFINNISTGPLVLSNGISANHMSIKCL